MHTETRHTLVIEDAAPSLTLRRQFWNNGKGHIPEKILVLKGYVNEGSTAVRLLNEANNENVVSLKCGPEVDLSELGRNRIYS